MNEDNIIAIGDIHGCSRTLKKLVKDLEIFPDHRLLFVGDYIDRGASSSDVISFLLELKNRRECIFLRGNHEQMLLDALDKGERSFWLFNGGQETLESYGLETDNIDLPSDHLEFIRETKFWYETSGYFFVHAGLSPTKTIRQSLQKPVDTHDFLWCREHLDAPDTPWEKVVVFGHTPRPDLIRGPNMIGIDTGCVFSSRDMGTLTALVLPEGRVQQQSSLD